MLPSPAQHTVSGFTVGEEADRSLHGWGVQTPLLGAGGGRDASWSSALPRTLSEENRSIAAAIAESLRTTHSRLSRLSSVGVQRLLPGRGGGEGDDGGGADAPMARQGSTPEFLCRICYCNDAVANAYVLPCGHKWHKDCLMGLIKSKVADAQLQITCPHMDDENERELLDNAAEVGCTHIIDKGAILSLAAELGDVELPQQYARFESMQANPNIRECPVAGCGHRQAGDPRTPRMVCEMCSTECAALLPAFAPGSSSASLSRCWQVLFPPLQCARGAHVSTV